MRKPSVAALASCTVLVLGACRPQEPAPIPFDTVPPATTEPAPQTLPTIAVSPDTSVADTVDEPADVVAQRWEDATSNLVGLRSECGNLTYVSARPDERQLITGVSLQGLWSSVNGGDEWGPLAQGEGSEEFVNRLTSVVYDPEVPERYWVTGLYNGFGIYRTDDDGATFTHLGDIVGVDNVSIDFTDPERQTMLAALHESMAVMLSTDGGATWADASGDLPGEGGQLSAVMLIDPTTFIAGVWNGQVPGVYRTVDGGTTWTRVHPEPVVGMPFRAQDGNLYWLLERGAGVITSSDDGATWTRLDGSGISPFAVSLVELPDGRFASFGGTNVVVSGDHGASWRQVGPGMPYDPNGLTYSPHDEAFFIWRFSCDLNGENPILENTILRLGFAPIDSAGGSVPSSSAGEPATTPTSTGST